MDIFNTFALKENLKTKRKNSLKKVGNRGATDVWTCLSVNKKRVDENVPQSIS